MKGRAAAAETPTQAMAVSRKAWRSSSPRTLPRKAKTSMPPVNPVTRAPTANELQSALPMIRSTVMGMSMAAASPSSSVPRMATTGLMSITRVSGCCGTGRKANLAAVPVAACAAPS